MLDNKRKIRRASEAAGLSYTYVSANSFAAYFVDYLLHPHEKREEVLVYGSGEAKGEFIAIDPPTHPHILVFYLFSFFFRIIFQDI